MILELKPYTIDNRPTDWKKAHSAWNNRKIWYCPLPHICPSTDSGGHNLSNIHCIFDSVLLEEDGSADIHHSN